MKKDLIRLAIALFFLAGILTLLSAVTGCTALKPDYYEAGIGHTSHPFAGWPFGPDNEEDALTQFEITAVICRDHWTVRQGLGYKLDNAGFYGPRLTYNGGIYRTFGGTSCAH